MATKLSTAQQRAWNEITHMLANRLDDYRGWHMNRDGSARAGFGTGVSRITLRGIERAGLIQLLPDGGTNVSKRFSITDAGKAEIALAETLSVNGLTIDEQAQMERDNYAALADAGRGAMASTAAPERPTPARCTAMGGGATK